MIDLTVNGATTRIDVDPATPLLYVLRDDLGLHAAKFGCGLGQCGACTVLVDDKPVFSCLLPVGAIGSGRLRRSRDWARPQNQVTFSAPFFTNRRRNAAIASPA
ncbi:2Fe-2S iron-sulfur cluster-binding protein [Sphingomonas sp. LB2R24]|uniref:(2Fe-2S)-binding protein n=1 Tax=Sphingomonas sorbitolis TaxID=3096165 RepID=UPI002FCC9B11